MSKPAHKIRDGFLQVTIWRNTGDRGTWYSIVPTRSYKPDNGFPANPRLLGNVAWPCQWAASAFSRQGPPAVIGVLSAWRSVACCLRPRFRHVVVALVSLPSRGAVPCRLISSHNPLVHRNLPCAHPFPRCSKSSFLAWLALACGSGYPCSSLPFRVSAPPRGLYVRHL